MDKLVLVASVCALIGTTALMVEILKPLIETFRKQKK